MLLQVQEHLALKIKLELSKWLKRKEVPQANEELHKEALKLKLEVLPELLEMERKSHKH